MRSRPLRFFIQFDSKRASVPKVADYRNNHIGSRGSKENPDGIQPSAEEVSEWQVNQEHPCNRQYRRSQWVPQGIKNCRGHHDDAPSAVADWQND